MIRCPDCNSPNIFQGVGYYIPESLEQATRCTCNDCGATFESYSDITDPDERRDLRNYAEMQREERGDY
jgi:DNA-directed RNA polymerase subunit RPC12/RpoP